MRRINLKFVQGFDFALIENLPNKGTKYLLIFYDFCEKISNSELFVKTQGTEYKTYSITCFIKANWEEMLSYKVHI